MKRVLAITVMSVLAFLGFAGTASAADDIDEALLEKCEAEFGEAFFALTDHLDDVQFEQLLYDIDDVFFRFEQGLINEAQLEAELEALLPGLVGIFIDFFDCIDSDVPKKPDTRKPATVPTAVPAGALPDTGAGATAALVGLGLAAAGGAILLGRRLVSNS